MKASDLLPLGALVSANKKTYSAYAKAKTEQLAECIIANRYDPYEQELERIMKGCDYPLAYELRSILVGKIKSALADGAIITRPVPTFLQDVFERLDPSHVEGVLRLLVNDGTYDRSILEHVKTRAPWVVRGSTVHDQMIRDMADEYDVFDQDRLAHYQNRTQVNRFVVVPIDLIRNNNSQTTNANKVVIDAMFTANPNATLVVNYGDATVANGVIYYCQQPLPDSVHHISFVGERVTRTGTAFLAHCPGLLSIDFGPLSGVREIEQIFLRGCSVLTSVNLRNVFGAGRSVIYEALEREKESRNWQGRVVR